MIKLKKLLETDIKPLPKNKYVELSKQELDSYKEILYNLISSSYKSKGGNPEFNPSDDIIKSDINIWYAADIDKDPEIDVTVGAKKKEAGTKISVMGQDGTPAAKKSAITKVSQLLMKRGYYAELSPDLAEKFGLQPITDEDIIRDVLHKNDIKFTGNGHYMRSIDGITRTKVLVGQPIYTTEAYKPMSRSQVIHMKRARKKAKTAKRKKQLRKARLKYRKKKSIVKRKSQQRKRKLGARIKRAAARRNL